jgi:formylglycine-generating enzyme required for sulfatase activity
LPTYEIAHFPVTVAEYACFVRSGQLEPKRVLLDGPSWKAQLQQLDHPVVNVSWDDAQSYAKWLSLMTGVTWRLPTEGEWEKAARGTDGRIYPWGDEFEQWRCNTSGSGKKTTTPVGTYPGGASPYGVQDMAGNGWEWTSSLYKPYPYKEADGRNDLKSNGSRVLRGGSWGVDARGARAASRAHPLVISLGNGGFRVVRVASSS